jgi:hypothetical protein
LELNLKLDNMEVSEYAGGREAGVAAAYPVNTVTQIKSRIFSNFVPFSTNPDA